MAGKSKQQEQAVASGQGSATDKTWALYSDPKDSASYFKLVEQLISPTSEIESCVCLITDTVFIGEDGKPQLFAKTDRDGRVTSL